MCCLPLPSKAWPGPGVKDKEGIKGQKLQSNMHIFLNNCQFISKFWIRPDKAHAFLVNTHLKFSLVTKMEPLNLYPPFLWRA